LALTALWLGVLTSISPCPLASNIAAISFTARGMTRRGAVLWSGLAYAAGRAVVYTLLGLVIVQAAINIPRLSNLLQQYANKVLGILFVLVGMYLLELLPLNLPTLSLNAQWAEKARGHGILSGLWLGALLALAFCPVSAALFFGSLIPLAIAAGGDLFLPALYGVGTAAPVLVFAVAITAGAAGLDLLFRKVARVEYYLRRATGVILILVGIYYILANIFYIF
jgi:cytochrome c biogenesis protein CcdA